MRHDSSPHIERLRAHAEQAIAYEEAGAKKDGRIPDETWDEWQRGRDILGLIEQLEAERTKIRLRDSALRGLEGQKETLQRERDQLEEWLRFYSADDVDVDYMLANHRRLSYPARKPTWAEWCPACKGYPDQAHRNDWTCDEPSPASDPLKDALHLLADEAMESGQEIGEAIEERRAQSPAKEPGS